MSKKKNTLNDLEEFLKLQASSLVTPASLSQPAEEKFEPKPIQKTEDRSHQSGQKNLRDQFAEVSNDKNAFYDLIIKTTEQLPNQSKDDIMLINTALYLKGGTDWKETIKKYWDSKR